MKKYSLLVFLVALALLSTAQNPNSNQFFLSGEIKNAKVKMVYLSYTDISGNKVQDSCSLQNNRFSFKGSISEPVFAVLKTNTKFMADDENKNITALFLEPVDMKATLVQDNFAQMILTGSKTHDEYNEQDKRHKAINEKYSDSLNERHSRLTEEYIFKHRDSYISAYYLSLYRSRWPADAVGYLYSRFNTAIHNTFYGKQIKSFLEELESNSEGNKANEFLAKDINGKALNLSGFKGKYVLLDFWGSWCIPCRESSPHLIELYNKYSAKGFTVIGIATEYEKTDNKWKEAIQKDGTGIWYNVLSNPIPASPEFTKDIAGIFGVHVYPTKLLIDPCGYIIGRFHGTGDDVKLDKKLKAIFN